MQRQSFEPEGLAKSLAPVSPVIVSGDLVLVSGQVPFDAEGRLVSEEMAAQTRKVFENIGRCLEAAGCSYQDVVKVGAFLSDLNDFPTYNEVYQEYFKEPYPARTTVQAGLLGFRIEVDAIGRLPSS